MHQDGRLTKAYLLAHRQVNRKRIGQQGLQSSRLRSQKRGGRLSLFGRRQVVTKKARDKLIDLRLAIDFKSSEL